MKKQTYAALVVIGVATMICTAAVPLGSLSPNSPVPTASDISTAVAAEATLRGNSDTAIGTRITVETNRAQIAEAVLSTNAIVVSRIATNLLGARVVTNVSTLSTNVFFFDVRGMLTNLTVNP